MVYCFNNRHQLQCRPRGLKGFAFSQGIDRSWKSYLNLQLAGHDRDEDPDHQVRCPSNWQYQVKIYVKKIFEGRVYKISEDKNLELTLFGFVSHMSNDHVRNVLNVSFGRSQNCLILKCLHLLLRADAYIYMYSLLIIRPLLYGRDRTAVTVRPSHTAVAVRAVEVRRCRCSAACCCRLLSTILNTHTKNGQITWAHQLQLLNLCTLLASSSDLSAQLTKQFHSSHAQHLFSRHNKDNSRHYPELLDLAPLRVFSQWHPADVLRSSPPKSYADKGSHYKSYISTNHQSKPNNISPKHSLTALDTSTAQPQLIRSLIDRLHRSHLP
jgi:hypothetical protein